MVERGWGDSGGVVCVRSMMGDGRWPDRERGREEVFADIRVGERERGVKVVGGRERDGVEFAAG